MDKFEEYVLDKIEEYRKDSISEPSEKENNNVVIGELLQVLSQYQINKGVA